MLGTFPKLCSKIIVWIDVLTGISIGKVNQRSLSKGLVGAPCGFIVQIQIMGMDHMQVFRMNHFQAIEVISSADNYQVYNQTLSIICTIGATITSATSGAQNALTCRGAANEIFLSVSIAKFITVGSEVTE